MKRVLALLAFSLSLAASAFAQAPMAAFHTDLGEQYLRNGGLNGVRFGGLWGMGRFGMMYGWGRLGNPAASQPRTLEGKLGFIDDNPVLETKDATYLLGFPNFYYYAYTDGITKGANLKVSGYSFAPASSADKPYFAVSKATINGKSYDFGSFGYGAMGGPGMMGGGYGRGIMGGYGQDMMGW